MDRVILSFEEAINKLPDGDLIHTFKQGSSGILFGADREREDIVRAIKDYGCELSGEQATLMKHGMVIRLRYGLGNLFIETKEE